MSGRLVILRHKSWNVWNKDNQEKVLRDERLHREKLEAIEQQQRSKLQEQTIEELRIGQSPSSQDSTTGNVSSVAEAKVIPFRLFEDIERKSSASKLGHQEFLKEEKEREQRKRRKEGLNDWALGEHSYEIARKAPWFEKPRSSTSDQMNTEKNPGRKDHTTASDPMKEFIHTSKKTKKTDDLDMVDKTYFNSNRAEDQGRGQDTKDQLFQELRRKRLEREKQERKRTNMLLAQADVYGVPEVAARSGHKSYPHTSAVGYSASRDREGRPRLKKFPTSSKSRR